MEYKGWGFLRVIPITIIFVGGLVFLSGCDLFNSDKSDDKIVIGEFASLSGPFASFGNNAHRGIQLAVEEQNKLGGIRGRKLELIALDDRGRVDSVSELLGQLIEDNQTIAILGAISSSISLAAAPIAQQHEVPMVTPSSTNPKVTEVGPYIFRACFIDPFQGYVMAKFASEKLGLKRIAILKDNNSEYSAGLASNFKKTFSRLKGTIIADETYDSGDVDFRSQLVRIKLQKPDAIYLPGYYSEVGLIAKQVRELGIKAHLLGGDGWDTDKLYEIAKESINGGYFSSHFASQAKSKLTIDFDNRFHTRYESRPDSMAAMGYDAANLLIEAIKKAKTVDRTGVRRSLASIKNFPGVTGNITFNKNRNAIKPAVIIQVNGVNNDYVTTIEP